MWALWRNARRMPYPIGPVFALLALTAQRVNVIGKLTWDEVDLGKRELRVAGDRMKMEEPVVVPLSNEATRIIERLPTGPE